LLSLIVKDQAVGLKDGFGNNDKTTIFGTPGNQVVPVIKVNNPQFYSQVFWRYDVGLGEAYVKKDWEMEQGDLGQFFTVIASNFNRFGLLEYFRWLSPLEWYRWVKELKDNNDNTVENSEKQIDVHYNLGNDWYSAFLDPSMTYTSGRFEENKDDSLEIAQKNKRDLVLKKALLHYGENKRVLDIGCGWGTLCNDISKLPSVSEVIGICNSEMMIKNSKENYKGPQFIFSDYRTYTDSKLYDVITSIEMLEAVGVSNFPEFANICSSLLKPKGRVVLQVITAPRFLNHTAKKKKERSKRNICNYLYLPWFSNPTC